MGASHCKSNHSFFCFRQLLVRKRAMVAEEHPIQVEDHSCRWLQWLAVPLRVEAVQLEVRRLQAALVQQSVQQEQHECDLCRPCI